MRLALLLVLAGCDGIWDLEHIERDAAARDTLDAPPPADLIAWFPLETAATGIVQEVVAGANGTCTGGSCPSPTAGVRGGALLFDGSAQLITAVPAAAVNAQASFTIAVWARMDRSIPEGFACVLSKRYGVDASNTWQLCTYFDAWRLVTVTTMITGPAAALGEWHHLAASWNADTTELVFYLDGVIVGAPMFYEVPFDSGGLIIGGDIDSTNAIALFPGAIDDVRVYNRALTASEIIDAAVRD